MVTRRTDYRSDSGTRPKDAPRRGRSHNLLFLVRLYQRGTRAATHLLARLIVATSIMAALFGCMPNDQTDQAKTDQSELSSSAAGLSAAVEAPYVSKRQAFKAGAIAQKYAAQAQSALSSITGWDAVPSVGMSATELAEKLQEHDEQQLAEAQEPEAQEPKKQPEPEAADQPQGQSEMNDYGKEDIAALVQAAKSALRRYSDSEQAAAAEPDTTLRPEKTTPGETPADRGPDGKSSLEPSDPENLETTMASYRMSDSMEEGQEESDGDRATTEYESSSTEKTTRDEAGSEGRLPEEESSSEYGIVSDDEKDTSEIQPADRILVTGSETTPSVKGSGSTEDNQPTAVRAREGQETVDLTRVLSLEEPESGVETTGDTGGMKTDTVETGNQPENLASTPDWGKTDPNAASYRDIRQPPPETVNVTNTDVPGVSPGEAPQSLPAPSEREVGNPYNGWTSGSPAPPTALEPATLERPVQETRQVPQSTELAGNTGDSTDFTIKEESLVPAAQASGTYTPTPAEKPLEDVTSGDTARIDPPYTQGSVVTGGSTGSPGGGGTTSGGDERQIPETPANGSVDTAGSAAPDTAYQMPSETPQTSPASVVGKPLTGGEVPEEPPVAVEESEELLGSVESINSPGESGGESQRVAPEPEQESFSMEETSDATDFGQARTSPENPASPVENDGYNPSGWMPAAKGGKITPAVAEEGKPLQVALGEDDPEAADNNPSSREKSSPEESAVMPETTARPTSSPATEDSELQDTGVPETAGPTGDKPATLRTEDTTSIPVFAGQPAVRPTTGSAQDESGSRAEEAAVEKDSGDSQVGPDKEAYQQEALPGAVAGSGEAGAVDLNRGSNSETPPDRETSVLQPPADLQEGIDSGSESPDLEGLEEDSDGSGTGLRDVSSSEEAPSAPLESSAPTIEAISAPADGKVVYEPDSGPSDATIQTEEPSSEPGSEEQQVTPDTGTVNDLSEEEHQPTGPANDAAPAEIPDAGQPLPTVASSEAESQAWLEVKEDSLEVESEAWDQTGPHSEGTSWTAGTPPHTWGYDIPEPDYRQNWTPGPAPATSRQLAQEDSQSSNWTQGSQPRPEEAAGGTAATAESQSAVYDSGGATPDDYEWHF